MTEYTVVREYPYPIEEVWAVLTDPELPSGSDRILAALAQLDPGFQHDVVINLQGDMPFVDPAVLSDCARILKEFGDADNDTDRDEMERAKDRLKARIRARIAHELDQERL